MNNDEIPSLLPDLPPVDGRARSGDKANAQPETVKAKRSLRSTLSRGAEERKSVAADSLAGLPENLQRYSMPEIRRLSIIPERLDRNPFTRLWRRAHGKRRAQKPRSKPAVSNGGSGSTTDVSANWRQAARRRRLALVLLIAVQTGIATWSLTNTFPYPWLNGFQTAIVAVFAILFSWISFGFWTSLVGFWLLWKRTSRFSVDVLDADSAGQRELCSRTAVLMPICSEDVKRVFSGVEATYRSLAATGSLSHFDFFILSDSHDGEQQVEEEVAWAQLCRSAQAFGKIFYRHRRNNIKRKSGNIADFLRRCGYKYDYMIVLDADSIMTGAMLVRLAHIMDRCPQAGIVQTAPRTINRESLYARVQQFANHVYGPMLTAGLRFWQLGESYYWGHNAILRVQPFIRHCGLARLPGKPPLGGEILSHDFVEAALMGRAGQSVWILEDSAGSYEENPPSLLDDLKRDRRWCQGNLQHLKFLFADGLRGGHIAIFIMGIMAYASTFLWLIFLLLSSIEAAAQAILPPIYFSSRPSLFPLWPQWRPEWAIALVSTTAILLFLPKFLSFLLICKNRETRLFGGFFPLAVSIVGEIVLSSLLAPVRMWFHSKFVLQTLLGRQIKWSAQQRADAETHWRNAVRFHGGAMTLALLWIGAMSRLNPSFVWWLLPVAVPLALSAPLSVYSSRTSLGRKLRRWRLFLIPEETDPPEIVKSLHANLKRRENDREGFGFDRAVRDPFAYAVHTNLLRGKASTVQAKVRNRALLQKAMAQESSLTSVEKACLLRDADSLARLHEEAGRVEKKLVQ